MKVVQIGSNKGNDDLAKFLRKNFVNLDLGIFVEANPHHIDDLKNCYDQYSNICVENLAIKLPHCPNNQTPLYINLNVSEDHHEEATTIREQIIGDNVAYINVPCLSLDELFQKHNIAEIDWLLIDAEGLDADILLSMDWKKYNIRRVDCESFHFKEKRDIIDKMFYELGYTKVVGLQYYFDDAWIKSKDEVDDLITKYAITSCRKDYENHGKENSRILSTLSQYDNLNIFSWRL